MPLRRVLLVPFATAALAAAGCSPPALQPCGDCNIVLISVDTLRADHVGAYGYPRPTTPNIDALARRGVLFENAIAQSSWTRPAHMSIFTGLHPREHGFVALMDARPLDDGVPTLASVLADRGWATAGFSGGINMAARFGFGRGFETYRNNGMYFRDNFEDARFWLDRNQHRRFFLFFHGYDAHTPYRGDAIDRRDIGLASSPPRGSMKKACGKGKPSRRLAAFVDEYDAAVRRADRYVGKMIAEIEARGLAGRTIFVLLSDHGEEFLEHGRCFHVSTLHREVLHVPLIVVAPGLEPRRVAATVAASVTVAPTLMDLVGIGDHPFPGPSLAEAARGFDAPDEVVASETEKARGTGGDGHVRAISGDGFKFIHWSTQQRAALYELPGDVAEKKPRVAGSGVERHSADLEHWAETHPSRFAPRRRAKPGTGPDPATGAAAGAAANPPEAPSDAAGENHEDPAMQRREEQLRSLGYAE